MIIFDFLYPHLNVLKGLNVQGIECLGPIDGEKPDTPIKGYQNIFIVHLSSVIQFGVT
jgi:hypothetical protein